MTIRPSSAPHRHRADIRPPSHPGRRAVITIPAAEVNDRGWQVVHLPAPGTALPGLHSVTLSRREHEIVAGFACGQSNDEIAAALGLSPATVKTHAARIFRKLGARNRSHAVAKAFRVGLLPYGPHPVFPDNLLGGTASAALSPREREVLAGLACGLTDKQIGAALCLTENTVKTHNRRMFRKLGAHDSAHAVAKGYLLGLLPFPECEAFASPLFVHRTSSPAVAA